MYKREDPFFNDHGVDPKLVPRQRLEELIAKGELYAWWGQRLERFPDVEPTWWNAERDTPTPAVTDDTHATNE